MRAAPPLAASSIAAGFPSLSFDKVDAALVFPPGVGPTHTNNVAYLFRGDSYVKWDLSRDSECQGPTAISDGFSGLSFDKVDSVLVFPPGVGPGYARNVAYIISGDSYVKWDLETDTLCQERRRLAAGFPSLSFDGVDAALVFPPGVGPGHTNKFAYLFRGGSYVKWDLDGDSECQGPRAVEPTADGYGFSGLEFTDPTVVPSVEKRECSGNHVWGYSPVCAGGECRFCLGAQPRPRGFSAVNAVLVFPPGVGPGYARNVAYITSGDSYVKWDLRTDTLLQERRKTQSASNNGVVRMLLGREVRGHRCELSGVLRKTAARTRQEASKRECTGNHMWGYAPVCAGGECRICLGVPRRAPSDLWRAVLAESRVTAPLAPT